MNTTSEPAGTLEVALAHTARLLESRPDLAAEQAEEILKLAPQHALATLLLGVARRRNGDASAALQVLGPLSALHPQWALAHYEVALAYGERDCTAEAVAALRRALALKPEMADAWRALGDQLTIAGDAAEADAAYAQNIKASTKDPRLLKAAAALCDNKIPEAEHLLRTHLKKFPTDVAALRMLAEVAARLQRFADAEALLARCLELAPSFTAARHHHAIMLHRQSKSAAALEEVDELLAEDPRHPGYSNLKAAILARIGELDGSIEVYAAVLAQHPEQPKIWMSYGHALKTKGREQEGIAAYRKSIELQPSLGEAYWSLANLKTAFFTDLDLASMRVQLANPKITDEDKLHLNFALGKALEDRGAYAESFENYAIGNRLRRTQIFYNPQEMSEHVARVKALCTAPFFADRAAHGATAPDPIFIVGLPRSGSTLLEQILSSHSQVEGTMELPDIPVIARTLFDKRAVLNKYAECDVLLCGNVATYIVPNQPRTVGVKFGQKF
jgi:tetratricopeptide (TPR) repeat protein